MSLSRSKPNHFEGAPITLPAIAFKAARKSLAVVVDLYEVRVAAVAQH
jgi:hypothetical protein